MNETLDLDELERLARAALQFLDWAAGEGICPTEEGVPSPDVPLFEFASKTGNEDYASYPDVISGVFARLREAERERDGAREKLAAWMIERSFATGHGDTLDDLLSELAFSVAEIRAERDRLKAELDEAVGVIRDVANPIGHLQRYATSQGGQLDGVMAHQMANDPNFIKGLAAAFIAKHGGSDG